MITVVDYGMGNIGSVLNMLKKIGAGCVASDAPEAIGAASKLILPGVGAFDQGMAELHRRGLVDPLREAAGRKVPILGICLGMQLLGRSSEEGVAEGLGLVAADTRRIRPAENAQTELRVPHMGWNTVSAAKAHPLLHGMLDDARFYFVHTYHVVCDDPGDRLLETRYGGPLTAALASDNVLGVQFHPEKSHKFGMAMLKNYADMH